MTSFLLGILIGEVIIFIALFISWEPLFESVQRGAGETKRIFARSPSRFRKWLRRVL